MTQKLYLILQKNYSFILQDAAQGFIWNSQVTIRQMVFYYRNADTGCTDHLCFAMISDHVHDTVTVYTFQKVLMKELKEYLPLVLNVYYFSDSCGDLYKNFKNFVDLAYRRKDFGISAEWHFFATSYGKIKS